ncbi:hypothetical protein PROFUN_00914 [Planoprotostelium fungivorum]|uniref:C3H1-type domain-containing protein n=1 Tax=Planoprotostelium fungivorum TaxID=1890364 RepID=A0A2P6P0C9_9EUKA|nr:hypothetical protein PROFUN_00914 [Planoprotostelium fungivorum]
MSNPYSPSDYRGDGYQSTRGRDGYQSSRGRGGYQHSSRGRGGGRSKPSEQPCKFFATNSCRNDPCQFKHDAPQQSRNNPNRTPLLETSRDPYTVEEALPEHYADRVDDVSSGVFIIGPKILIERCSKTVNQLMDENFKRSAPKLQDNAKKCSPDGYKTFYFDKKIPGLSRRKLRAMFYEDKKLDTQVLDETEHVTTFAIPLTQSMHQYSAKMPEDIRADAVKGHSDGVYEGGDV